MIKRLFAVLGLLLSVSAHAADKDLTFLFYYPPGGGHELGTSAFKPYLEKNGYKVNYVFYKTCAEALAHLNKGEPNTLLSAATSDYNTLPDAKCQFSKYNNMQVYIAPTRTTKYICYSPKNKDLKVEDLLGEKTYTVGIIADDFDPPLIQNIINNSKLKLKPIKYKSGNDLRAAAVTGDVDSVFVGAAVGFMLEQGGKCVLSTVKNNTLKVPFIGNYMNGSMPETGQTLVYWSAGPIDSSLYGLIKNAQKQPEYVEFTKKAMTDIINVSPQDIYADMRKEEAALSSLRKN